MNSPFAFYGFSSLIIVALFAAKSFLLRSLPRRFAAFSFSSLLLLAVPVAWAISPDWHNPSVAPIANWIGTPVLLLAVPAMSFLIDAAMTAETNSLLRNVAEVLIGVPVWFVCWIFVEFAILGWVWI